MRARTREWLAVCAGAVSLLSSPAAVRAQLSAAAADVTWLSDADGQISAAAEPVQWDTTGLCVAHFAFTNEGAHAQRTLLRLPGTRFILVSIAHCTKCAQQAPLSSRIAVAVHRSTEIEQVAQPLSGHALQQLEQWLANSGSIAELVQLLPDSMLESLLVTNARPAPFVSHWTRKLRGDHVGHYLIYRAGDAGGCVAPAIQASAQLFDTAPSAIPQPYRVDGIVGIGPELPADDAPLVAMALRSVRIEYAQRLKPPGYCTGLLLGGRWVLTARHCIQPCVDGADSAICGSYSMDVGFSVIRDTAREISDWGSYSLPLRIPRHAMDAPLELPLDYVVLEATEGLAGTFQPVPRTSYSFLVGSPGGYLTTLSRGVRFSDSFPGKDGPRLLHTHFAEEGLSGAPLWEPVDNYMQPTAIHTSGLRPCLEVPSDAGDQATSTPPNPGDDWDTLKRRADSAKAEWAQKYDGLKDKTGCVGQAISLARIHDRECSAGKPAALSEACVSLSILAKQRSLE